MRKLTILLIALFLMTPLFIMAQDSDCEDNEREEYYKFNTRQYKDLDVSISYGLGELIIGSNDDNNEIEGVIVYDSHRIKPEVTIENVSSSGVFKAKTKKIKDDDCRKKLKDFENEMEFYFPPDIKTDLFLDFGVGEAEIDLTNIAISKLDINCGLSDVELEINKRNDVICKIVNIESGLGDLEVYGLGNLAAKEIDVNVGLGSAEIDLTGDKIYDAEVDVDVGLGSLEMILPENVNIEVFVDASFLSSVDIYGLKKKKDKYWVTSDWDGDKPTISMDVNVGMGSVDIVVED